MLYPSKNKAQPFASLLRYYYSCFLAVFIFFVGWRFISLDLEGADWLWPVSWIPAEHATTIFIVLWGITVLATVLVIRDPFSGCLKAIAQAAFFLTLAAHYSFGKIDHVFHGWIFSGLFLMGIGCPEKTDPEKNYFLWSSAQSIFLFLYFLSGLWKVREFVRGIFDGETSNSISTLSFQLAKNVVELKPLLPLAEKIIVAPPWVSGALWLAVIGIEAGAIVAILRPQLRPHWGLAIVILHFSIFLTMQVNFFPAALLASVLLLNRLPQPD